MNVPHLRRDGSGTADLVTRSIEVILANQTQSGAFLASPTFGQYRYAWLRDGAFVAEALDLVGQHGASRRFHDWVSRVVLASRAGIERSIQAGRSGRLPAPGDYLHCRYEPDGRPGPEDWPTFQLDGPGIWLWSLGQHGRAGAPLERRHIDAARLVARYVAALWSQPSNDAWEESPNEIHTSTLAALLAGLRALERIDPDCGEPLPEVAEARAGLESCLLENSNGSSANGFTKWSGNPAVDGSLLWLGVPYGLVDVRSPRFAATLAQMEREIVSPDGGVHRYASDTFYGGGEWILLTAALGRVYLRREDPGDRERAERARRWVEARAAPDGTLPEQVATRALHPERIDEWRQRWGESARPLLWSHAAYLALVHDLERA